MEGLDEAPNEAARETVSRLLERAARAWSSCRFVVTTRPKAYETEVMLAGFHEARIGPLEPEAVRTFLQRWTEALIPENPQRAQQHARELIQAVESRADLRRTAGNAVMLTALAVLHWNEKRMPEQRADLYESILVWLARSRRRRPGRLSPEDCIQALQELAGAMQEHADGRLVQAPRDWAADAIAPQFQGDRERARRFLEEEEKDSGIVVNRGADVKFWHLTFQEFLAEQARCFGLLGAMLRDLQPLGYTPRDPRYEEVKNAVLGIFEDGPAAAIPLQTRLAAADALGQSDDPRLRLPADTDYWVKVESFEIGRYTITVYEYGMFVAEGGPKPEDWDRQVLRPNCPVVSVSWFDAKAYCDWSHVRLPTEAEWERAARGPEGREYPWGNEEPDSDRANYDKTKLQRVSPVGLFPRGSTPDGIADLAGNVWEWVASSPRSQHTIDRPHRTYKGR